MTNFEIKSNKLIADFIKIHFPNILKIRVFKEEVVECDNPDYTVCKFHKDHNWLIPVAKVIVDKYYGRVDLDIDDLLNAGGRYDLEEIYEEVVGAINRINKLIV